MPLTFHAPLLTTIVPATAAGSAAATFTRATAATVIDHDGIVRRALSGEARFHGARRVENLIHTAGAGTADSESPFTGWNTGTMTVTPSVADPLGTNTAATITATGADQAFYAVCTVPYGVFGDGRRFVNSGWIRRRAGSGLVSLRDTNNQTNYINVTDSWQRFVSPAAIAQAGTTCFNVVHIVASGDAVDIAFMQTEEVTGKSNAAPSEYVSVGVASSPYHGAAVDGVKYFPTANGNWSNLLSASEEFNLPAWAESPGGVTVGTNVSPNVETAPDGTLTADKIYETGTTDEHRRGTSIVGLATDRARRFSFYAKAAERSVVRCWSWAGGDTSAQLFDLSTGAVSGSLNPTTENVGNGWWRCSCNVSATTAHFLVIGPASSMADGESMYLGTVSWGIYVWGAMLEVGTTTHAYVPSHTVGEGTGAAIADATLRGYWYEQAATNRCLRSEEFDNAAWTKTNLTVTPNIAPAPDGTVTSDVLQSTAANGTCIQDLGVVASAPKTGSVWLSRRAGSSAIQLTMDGGATWTTVVPPVTPLWQRFAIKQTLANEDFGIRLVGNGDMVDVWGGQVESFAGGFLPIMSSYVPTTAAAVGRNADNLSHVSASNIAQVNWTVYYEAQRDDILGGSSTPDLTPFSVGSYSAPGSITLGNYGPGPALTMLGAWPGVWDVSFSGTPGGGILSGVAYKAAFTMESDGDTIAIYKDGFGITGSCVVPKATNWGATINFGWMPAAGGQAHSATIKNVRIWDRVLRILEGGLPSSGGGIIWRRRGLRAR